MLDRLERLFRSWYGSVVEHVSGSGPTTEATPPTAPAPEPPANDLDARYEQLEGRRLLDEIRHGRDPGAASDVSVAPAPESEPDTPRAEKTIGPAPGQAARAEAPRPTVEKTIGPAPRPTGAGNPEGR